MSNTFTTPLMNLILPITGQEVGPTWADDLNNALQTVDTHDHTGGKGALISTAAININADLSFASFNAVTLRSARFSSQLAALSGAADKNCISVVGGNLYYNNNSGVAVQITSGSGLNAASIGGIGGDYATSTASESYTSATKTFSFTQSSGVTANLAAGTISIYQNILGAQPISISSPAGVGSSYTMTLPPALPASGTKIMTLTSTGQMGDAYDVDNNTIKVVSNLLTVQDQVIVPAGMLLPFAGAAAPAGFLLCNGATISRTVYATLFAAIGTAWGNGDGSTTFHLPDCRGRFLRGVDGAAGNDPDSSSRAASNSGGNTGNAVGTLQGDQFRSHAHSAQGKDKNPDSSTDHGTVQNGNGTAFFGQPTDSQGGNETRPKNVAVNYIIKY